MKIAFTSNSVNSSIIKYDTETQLVDRSKPVECLIGDNSDESGRPRYRPFGIDNTKDGFIVASNNNLVKISDNDEYSVLLDDLNVNSHQTRQNKNTVGICDTSVDIVRIIHHGESFDLCTRTGTLLEERRVSKNAYEEDKKHTNSLFIDDDYVYYLNSKDDGYSEFKKLDISTMKVSDIARIEGFFHDIEIVDGLLYTNRTSKGSLACLDCESGRLVYEANIPSSGFHRGLCIDGDDVYIGVTPMRWDSKSHQASAGIIRARIENGKISSFKKKRISTASVNDMRIIRDV